MLKGNGMATRLGAACARLRICDCEVEPLLETCDVITCRVIGLRPRLREECAIMTAPMEFVERTNGDSRRLGTGDGCGWERSVGGSWSASYNRLVGDESWRNVRGRRRRGCQGRQLLKAEDVKRRAKRWFGTSACSVLTSARDLVWGRRSFLLEVARRRQLLHPCTQPRATHHAALAPSSRHTRLHLLCPLHTHVRSDRHST